MANVDIYIISGQSNAVGTTEGLSTITSVSPNWDMFDIFVTTHAPLQHSNNLANTNRFWPEMTFADEMTLNGKSGYIAKMAFNGRWLGIDTSTTDFNVDSDELVETMKTRIQRIKNVVTADWDTAVFKWILWIHGERDAIQPDFASNYAHNFKNFLDEILTEIWDTNLPVCILDLHNWLLESNYKYSDIVRNQMRYVAATNWNVYMIEANETLLHDWVHYSSDAMETIWRQFAQLFINID